MAHTLLYTLLLLLCCSVLSNAQEQQRFNFRKWVKAALISDSVRVTYYDSTNHSTTVLYRKGDTLLLTGYIKEHGAATVYNLRMGKAEGTIAAHHIGFYYSTGYYAPGTQEVKKQKPAIPADTLPDGKIIYTGRYGGKYYLDSNGKRVYVK